jgi:hypothetical protein
MSLGLLDPCGAGGGLAGAACGGAPDGIGSLTSSVTGIGFSAIASFVLGAAGDVLHDTAALLGQSTTPQLGTTWFSSTYWRMGAVATMLTLPFLFAAVVQALMRSDLALLVRAALGYLPLAMLAIAVAAPLTMLVLAATDQLCSFVSAAAGHESGRFLGRASLALAALSALTSSPALVFFVGLFAMAAAFVLWIELLMRAAAVYVIVLMLPLAFAALVWPARRIWAVRAVELLVALILSKFAIVAVLSLGGAAISSSAGSGSVTSVMAGAVLLVLAAFSPWALLRLIPLAELASGAASSLRGELRSADEAAGRAWGRASRADEWARSTTAAMRQDADRGAGSAGWAGSDPTSPPARDGGSPPGSEPAQPETPPASPPGEAGASAHEPPPDDDDAFTKQEPVELGPGITEARVRLPGGPPDGGAAE